MKEKDTEYQFITYKSIVIMEKLTQVIRENCMENDINEFCNRQANQSSHIFSTESLSLPQVCTLVLHPINKMKPKHKIISEQNYHLKKCHWTKESKLIILQMKITSKWTCLRNAVNKIYWTSFIWEMFVFKNYSSKQVLLGGWVCKKVCSKPTQTEAPASEYVSMTS